MHPVIAGAIVRERMAALRNEADLERLARSLCSPDARWGARLYTRLGFIRPRHRLRPGPVIRPAACPPG
jgi:hypothetical protein